MAKTNQNNLIFVLIVVLGIAGGYIYYSSFLPTQRPIQALAVPVNSLKGLENIRIDFGILDNSKYKSLKTFGESPVIPGPIGKKDIFAPF